MVGSQSLLPPNPTFGSKQTKFEEKFQTDFWFICHLQIKATVTAVACQRPGRDRVQALFVISERMAGRGGSGGLWGVLWGSTRGQKGGRARVWRPTRAATDAPSSSHSIPPLSSCRPLFRNQSRQMYSSGQFFLASPSTSSFNAWLSPFFMSRENNNLSSNKGVIGVSHFEF